jgi:hypothetical protein
MSFDLIELRTDFFRRDHLIVDMTCFCALWWKEFIVVFESFDCVMYVSNDDNRTFED